MEQKRRLRRRYAVARIRLKPAGPGRWSEAVLLNISKEGIGLYATRPLRKKEAVAIRLAYLDRSGPRDTEQVQGVVRWVKRIGSHYAAGIAFEAVVTKESFPLLARCVARASSSG